MAQELEWLKDGSWFSNENCYSNTGAGRFDTPRKSHDSLSRFAIPVTGNVKQGNARYKSYTYSTLNFDIVKTFNCAYNIIT